MTEQDLKLEKFLENGGMRVSSIVGMIPTKDAEDKWCYPLRSINQDVLQRKKDLGTTVHRAIAAHCKDEFLPINAKEDKFLDSYLKWEKEMNVCAGIVEERLYHDVMKLTGCIDMVAVIGGKRYITDFKCTVSADPVKWPIQGALYHLLAETNNIQVEKTTLFVQLDPKGELPKVHKYTITDNLMLSAISWYNAYNYLTNK